MLSKELLERNYQQIEMRKMSYEDADKARAGFFKVLAAGVQKLDEEEIKVAIGQSIKQTIESMDFRATLNQLLEPIVRGHLEELKKDPDFIQKIKERTHAAALSALSNAAIRFERY